MCYVNLIGKILCGCRWHQILWLKAIAPTYGVKELEGQLVTTMNCPDCGDEQTRVIDTETSADGTSVRRRRECQRCSFRFTTYERPEWDSLQVKKRNGTIEPFNRTKLRAGIERAVEKRDVSETTVTTLVDDIESALQDRETRLVSSSLIGELVSDRLRDLDKVAYIRFVSVYKAFSEPQEFLRELDAVLNAEIDDFEAPNDSQ
nr:transcriptional regulator NrdR [Halorubrum lacusprofundi]